MPVNIKYICPFIANEMMHICCKTTGDNLLFRNDKNRFYFLRKYAEYTKGYAETYSYILLDNHAHFLVRCVDEEALTNFIKIIPGRQKKLHQEKFLKKEITFEQALEYQYKDFFVCYAMSYNKMYHRNGSLFIRPFKRINVKDSNHFTSLIIYIHANMVRHGISENFEKYLWSSYRSILSEKSTLLKRGEVLEWFGGKDNFIQSHRTLIDLYYSNSYSLE